MHNRIQETFDQIHAQEDLKDKTKLFLAQKMRKDARNTPVRPRRMLMAAACLLLLLIGVGGYQIYFTPTAAISIDINPSIELGVNRFDQVISVDGYNDDGKELTDQLDLKFMNYGEAVEAILKSARIVELLDQDAELSIAVIGPEGTQCTQMLADVQVCTAGQKNASCYHADWSEVEQAHALGLSYGKYKAFLEVQALDPDVTPEDIQKMTMREIRDLIRSLSTDQSETSADQNAQQGNHGSGSGSGNGISSGSGNGAGNGSGNGSGDGTGSGGAHGAGNGTGNGPGKKQENGNTGG